MPVIYIDKKPFEVKAGKNLLESCLSLGFNLPYFCWHPAMGSVGACRQCAVKVYKDETDTKGRLVMSCMEPVREDLYLSIDDPLAKAFRTQIIEWLMTNHPHDCAVCDEGGSCHLQDMTVMTGHNYRRFNYKKRTYTNQYLGPFLNHEMNRCIQCYRCVRFYKDYAGGKDLDVYGAHDQVYFGRQKDGILESEFSGNLAEVCPTGVFTDKTLKQHYTRKWDFTNAPSLCQHCSVGCNTIASERYGEIRQITSRFNDQVNGYFLCDRGRFGYEFVNDINRIQQPLIRGNLPDAVDRQTVCEKIQATLDATKAIGIGSPRASLESNFALMQLVGKENFYQGVSEIETNLLKIILEGYNGGQFHIPSLKDIEQADSILILGEDLTNTAPVMALSIRQAVRNKPLQGAQNINIPEWHDAAQRELLQQEVGDLFIAHPVKTKLDEISKTVVHLSPDDVARFGFAISGFISRSGSEFSNLKEEIANQAKTVAQTLKDAFRPLIIAGTSLFNQSTIKAAISVAQALKTSGIEANLCFVVPECNSLGLAMMGAPSLDKAVQKIETGDAETLIILENDLYLRTTKNRVDSLFKNCKEVIALDHLHNATTNKANVVIPVAAFSEADGTLVNYEGRAQRFFQVFKPQNEHLTESWRWLDALRSFKNGESHHTWGSWEDLVNALEMEMPQFKGTSTVAPPPEFRIAEQKIPRESHRYSGRTAIQAHIKVSEPKPPQDEDSPLSFTMEGYKGLPPAPVTPFFWAPGWNSVQSINKYQIEVGGPLHGGQGGIKLFDNSGRVAFEILNYSPPGVQPSPDKMVIIPIHHIFGSDELSVFTKGINERAPAAYLAVNVCLAERFLVSEGEKLTIEIHGEYFTMPVQIKEEFPSGCVGIPYNIPELRGISWPARGTIAKEGA